MTTARDLRQKLMKEQNSRTAAEGLAQEQHTELSSVRAALNTAQTALAREAEGRKAEQEELEKVVAAHVAASDALRNELDTAKARFEMREMCLKQHVAKAEADLRAKEQDNGTLEVRRPGWLLMLEFCSSSAVRIWHGDVVMYADASHVRSCHVL